MKKILFGLLVLLAVTDLYSQEKISFKFIISDREELKKISDLILIENYKPDTVWASASSENFYKFIQLGYTYKIITEQPSGAKTIDMAQNIDQMKDWTKYPTHEVYIEMMNKFATQYPAICQLVNIGTSKDGRNIVAVKISDNVNYNEDEPDFLYTSTMHGDETTGYLLMLRLIDHLLSNYEKAEQITNLINNIEIFINPLSNPDATYAGGNNTVESARRDLVNGDDPNRAFPDPIMGDNSPYQTEIQAMMNFADTYNFVLSANFHGGAEVINYPWDTWEYTHNHADTAWFRKIARDYVISARLDNPDYFTSVNTEGVTVGNNWYEIDGGRQDYMNYYKNCREVTIEISDTKLISASQASEFWRYNKTSLINYISESLYGIRGKITDANGKPIRAKVTVIGHDKDNSEVYSDAVKGNYHRLIESGTFTLVFSAIGFSDITVNNVQVSYKNTTFVDVVFGGTLAKTNITGKIKDDSGNTLSGVNISIKNNGNDYTATNSSDGNFSVENIEPGTYEIKISKDGYITKTYFQTFNSNQTFDVNLVKLQSVSGLVISAQTGEFIEGAEIKILNSEMVSVFSNSKGEYSITGFTKGTLKLQVKKDIYTTKEQTLIIENDVTDNNFLLFTSVGESFETDVPANYTFSGNANWSIDTKNGKDGSKSMKSGKIDNLSVSQMILSLENGLAGNISFYKKVSSESTFDFLNFYIDNQLKDSWSGEVNWSKESYNINAGTHILMWEYKKDDFTAKGSDCAWIDFIEIPQKELDTYSLSFNISFDGKPVSGAVVELKGYGKQQTDKNGTAVFPAVYATPAGGLYLSVSSEVAPVYQKRLEVIKDSIVEIDLKSAGIERKFKKEIKIYPNPTTGEINIETSEKIDSVQVFDYNGKQIKHQFSKNKLYIENKGIFVLKIHTKNGVSVYKIVVE